MERALSNTEMDHLLTSEMFGHLGCCENGKPHVFPLAYVFRDNVLYGQTKGGKKIGILSKNPHVCFQVQQQKTHEWRSVMCWGTFEEFDFEKLDDAEAKIIVELLTKHLGEIQEDVGIALPRYSFNGKAKALIVNDRKSTLFRIVIAERTGRCYSAEK
jgi:nitroimidazol reductase NimA-like FMN-containing flavoprotein (pyridoxamine 5'-phosphate oxidase superfamily)